MSRSSLADPQKFQLASIVTKNSRTGITSNRRLLVARNGHLYYYSNIPKAFTGDNIKVLQQFHQLPKCSIEIINIIKINGLQPSSSYFSIQFQAKHMLEREDIRRTLLNQDFNFTPRNTKELVTWQFTCDNQFIKQRWVSALTHLKEYHKNQQLNMQKYFDSINNPPHSNEEIKSSNGSFSSRGSLKISPWRESVASRKSYTVDSNKYGFQYKEGSPKEGSNKLDESSWLKKGKSEDSKNFPQFQMIIEQHQIENALKLQPVKILKTQSAKKVQQPSKQSPQKQTIVQPPPIIEQVPQQPSISQTPIKQNSISDSQDHIERRQSMQRTLNELKLYSQTHSYKPILPSNQQLSPAQELSVPNLYIVQEKPELKSSKISGENSHTSRSLQAKAYSEKQNQTSRVFSIGCEFEWLLGECYKSDLKFDQKMQRQKQLIIYVQNFKQKVCGALSSFIEGKARNQHRYPVSQQPNHTVLVEVGNIKMKLAYVRTQNIQINGKNKIFFNEDSVKNLKRQFKIYRNLFLFISKKLKSEHTFNIRIPLALYIQYKGVSCIAFDQTSSYESIDLSDDDQWPIQKNIITEEGYKLQWFSYKRTGQFLCLYVKTRGKNIDKDDENLKEYFKKIIKISSQPKNHNIVFDSPIDKAFLQMAVKQNASTSLQSLQKYVKGLKNIKVLPGTCPKQQIITALEYCIYCKCLRKIYRSAQGEIDQTHFFNLVFKKDSSMMTLLEQSNCPSLTSIRGQLFSFIQYYFGVILEIDEKHFKVYQQEMNSLDKKQKKDLFFSTTVLPICREYPFSSLQIVESYAKLGNYLQNRHYLAEAALARKKQIYHLSSQNLTLSQSLELLYDQASYSFIEHDLVSCIRKCKQYQQICPHQYTKLFSIYLLMMKAYSQFSQNDFSITLKKATELIQYNYGNDHSSLISLFSLASFYYSKLSHKPNAKKQSNLISIATKLLKKAEQLCSKHFGVSSNQFLDITIDLARLYRQIDVVSAQKYVDQAQKICNQNTTLAVPDNIVSILIFQIQLNLQLGNLTEAQTSLFQALNFIDSKITLKTKKHLLKIQYQLGFYMQKYKYCEQAVQHLWQMGTNQKSEAIELAYKAAIRQSGISQSDSLIDQNDSVRFEGRPKTLLFIEQSKKQHQSLIELISNAIEVKNTKLLTMIYYLNRL